MKNPFYVGTFLWYVHSSVYVYVLMCTKAFLLLLQRIKSFMLVAKECTSDSPLAIICQVKGMLREMCAKNVLHKREHTHT